MTPLRQKMLDYLLIKGYSAHTIKSYLHHVQLFALHYNRCPSRLNLEAVQLYLAFLVKEKKYAQSSVNGAYSALKILFVHILDKGWDAKKIPRSKRSKTLPNVLSLSEVNRLFEVTTNTKHKAILMLLYSGGLRISEVPNLWITDIDSERMLIRVRQGKGAKDRYTLLSQKILVHLRLYYKRYRPNQFLFNGADSLTPISKRTVQHIFNKAKKKAQLTKPASTHTLIDVQFTI
ncbi:MAG: site-specific integrase [Bacteroidota bacterium]